MSAQPHDVQKAAQQWADEVLECRTLGHSWQQHRAEHHIKGRYWEVAYYCTRNCGVVKRQRWDEMGLIINSTMLYPRDEDGKALYLLEGLGRIVGNTRGVLRLESITRNNYVEIGVEEVNSKKRPARRARPNARRRTSK